MKRDMDVVRALLMKVEDIGDGAILEPTAEWVRGCSRETIVYHLVILHEAGLIHGYEKRWDEGSEFFPTRLTWQGHDFLDAAKNDSIWSKTVTKVKMTVGTVSFAVFQAVLMDFAKQRLGLS